MLSFYTDHFNSIVFELCKKLKCRYEYGELYSFIPNIWESKTLQKLTLNIKEVKRARALQLDEIKNCDTLKLYGLTNNIRINQYGPRIGINVKYPNYGFTELLDIENCFFEKYNYELEMQRFVEKYNNQVFKSLCVFDLDRVLIDDDYKIFKHSKKLIDCAKTYYDICVLWSHGNLEHVDLSKKEYKNVFIFDKTYSSEGLYHPKNLMRLYQDYPNVQFNKTLLIDDLWTNYAPEYNDYILVNSDTKNIIKTIKIINSTLQYDY